MLLTVHHSVKYDVISHLPLHLAWDLNHVFVQYTILYMLPTYQSVNSHHEYQPNCYSIPVLAFK
jgi:hypothetical protein